MNVPKLRFKEFDGEWEEKKIGDFFDHLSTGSTPSRTNPDYFKGEIPWISSGELKSHYISDTKEHVTELAVKETNLKIHPPGTFFIAITGLEAKGTRSSAAINTVPMTTNQSCLAFKPNDLIDLDFLYFWYKKNGERIGITYTQGTKQQSLTPGLVRDLDITVPKIEEQKYISRFFNIVDKKIQLQQQKIDLLQEQKKGYMQKIFNETLRFYGFKSEWKEYKLENVTDVRDGTHDSPKYIQTGYPLITSKNLKKNGDLDFKNINYISEEDFNKINQRSKVDPNDILFGMIGTIGNPVKVKDSNFAIKNVALIKHNPSFSNDYLIYYLKSSKVQKQFYNENKGGTQKFIALSNIRNLIIRKPVDKDEEELIIAFFDNITHKIKIEQKKLKLLQKQKQGFMQQMFI